MAKRRKNKIVKYLSWAAAAVVLLLSAVITFSPESVLPTWNQIFRRAGLNETADVTGYPFSVHFIDVGQADCALIKCENKNILVDAGEVNSYRTIHAYLQAQDVNYIDYLILTHAHSDHIGSAKELLENYEIGTIVMPRYSEKNMPTTDLYKNLLMAVAASGVQTIAAVPGTQYTVGSCSVSILAPNGDYSELNNSSVVIKAIYGTKAFLFQGDAEKKSEKDILAKGYNLSADVIKLGHHGSETSSTEAYLQAVRPTFAVISCGIQNQYGLPDESVIGRLEKNNIQYKRTDINGTIVIASDGNNLYLTSEK